MSTATSKWVFLSLTSAYLLAAHLSFTRSSPWFAAAAVALLFALLSASMKTLLPRVAFAVAGGIAVVCVANRLLPPVPLLVPPILVPLMLAWLFAHSLRTGSVPLAERFARALHEPDEVEPAMAVYARQVTLAWAVFLAAIAAANAWLALNLWPGGLLQLSGREAWWPVPPDTFVWLSNTATYLLIVLMFVAEFAVRVLRFPHYEFRNPVNLVKRARRRMPAILESWRRG